MPSKIFSKPVRLFGIEFAPLIVPLERRLQTLAVAYMSFSYFISPLLGAWLLWRLLWSTYWFIGAAYIAWMVYDNKCPTKDSRLRSQCARNATIYRLARDYFPLKLHKTCELDPKRSYLCGYHPHGIMPNGAVIGFGTNACGVDKLFDRMKVTLLSLGAMFWTPLYRDIALTLGTRNVYRETLKSLLSEPGNLVVLIVGGTAESLEGDPGHYSLVLKKRKGFVREAIRNGADLVPVFGFGENHSYSQLHQKAGSLARRIQEGCKRYTGCTIPFFCGRGLFQYSFGILPHRHSIDVVMGSPILVTKNPNPTNEEVDSTHAKYIEALMNLFETHKTRFEPKATLEIR